MNSEFSALLPVLPSGTKPAMERLCESYDRFLAGEITYEDWMSEIQAVQVQHRVEHGV